MRGILHVGIGAALTLLALGAAAAVHAQSSSTTFFVTSVGSGKGADLGGLDGRRQALPVTRRRRPARAAKTWHAYLSARRRAAAPRSTPSDRIGKGPWQNAKGVVVAKNVAELHGDQQPHQADGADREGRGRQRPRRHAEHARHPHGLAARRHRVRRRGDDKTCGNWTKSGDGSAIVGHSRPHRPRHEPAGAAHGTRRTRSRGCSDPALVSTGGAGLALLLRDELTT